MSGLGQRGEGSWKSVLALNSGLWSEKNVDDRGDHRMCVTTCLVWIAQCLLWSTTSPMSVLCPGRCGRSQGGWCPDPDKPWGAVGDRGLWKKRHLCRMRINGRQRLFLSRRLPTTLIHTSPYWRPLSLVPSLLFLEFPFIASPGPLWSTAARDTPGLWVAWAVLQVGPCGKGPASRTAKVCNVCRGLHLGKLSSYLDPSPYW